MTVYLDGARLLVCEQTIEQLLARNPRAACRRQAPSQAAGRDRPFGRDQCARRKRRSPARRSSSGGPRPVKLFLGVGTIGMGVRCLLAPAAVQGEHEHVRTVDVQVDDTLGTAAGRSQRVLPAECENRTPALSPKPPFSSSMTSLNARRSTARSPGDDRIAPRSGLAALPARHGS
jgi:hypothetical protein